MMRSGLSPARFGLASAAIALGFAVACGSSSDDGSLSSDLDGAIGADRIDVDASTEKDATSTADSSLSGDGGDGGDGATVPMLLQAGLKLWLDPAKNVTTNGGGTVTAWADQSGSNTPTTINNAPAFAAAGLGSRPAVRVATSSIEVTLASALAQRPFSIFAVGRGAVVAQFGQVIYLAGTPNIAFLAKETDDTARVRRLGATNFDLNSLLTNVSSKARVFGVRRKGATMEVRIDNTVASGVDPAGTFTVAAGTGSVAFGSFFAQGFFLGDLLIYDAELTDPEAVSVESFLKVKYGL